MPFFAVRKKFPFSQTKSLSFAQTFPYCHPKQPFSALRSPFQPPLTYCPQKIPIFTSQKLFFRTNLSLLLSKATLFHPPLPIPTPLNLLSAKNTAVLFIFALTPYAVKPEPRTDSNHCRRYPENCCFLPCRLPDECRSFSQEHRIDRRFESWVAGLRPACFLVTFCTTQKVTTRFPYGKDSRFCQPRISAPQLQLRTATIKTSPELFKRI